MNFARFMTIAKTAREERTVSAALVLLHEYATSRCATYPTDSALFRELWPNGNPPGFTLYNYHHMNTHTVRFAGEPR
jgi:hypothetical protein